MASLSINETRKRLEAKIEELISLLDLVDGDENLEPYLAGTYPDAEDREDENEHGGDIQDEPHDDVGENEDSLGWPNPCGPGGAPMHDWSPSDAPGVNQFNVNDLSFEGTGYDIGAEMLRAVIKDRRKLETYEDGGEQNSGGRQSVTSCLADPPQRKVLALIKGRTWIR